MGGVRKRIIASFLVAIRIIGTISDMEPSIRSEAVRNGVYASISDSLKKNSRIKRGCVHRTKMTFRSH